MNLILDIKLYQVEFAGGKVTELTDNVIAESMYTQYDADGKKYSLLDALYDNSMGQISYLCNHCRLENLLPVEGQFYLMGEVVQVDGISCSADS